MTYKIQCTCKHEFQDKTYGKQIRIATPTTRITQGNSRINVRCTVCGKEQTVKK